MSESLTTTTSSSVSAYAGMNPEDLIEAIKKQSRRARSKGLEMIESMKITGHMLIELKARTKHGEFLRNASFSTGLHERTIQRYIEIAKGVAPIRTITPRERITGKGDPLPLIKATEFLSEDAPPKNDTVSVLPAVESPPPAPSPRLPQIEIEAEIVEQPATATAPAQDDVENDVEDDVEEPPAPAVAPPTASPAPSMIETSETTFAEILGLLPRLRPVELKELVTVINTRWLSHPAPAPVDHLAACWKSATPEQRAAFLETAHLIEKP